MRILACGVRGSLPVSGGEYAKYGGQTTCLLALGEAGEAVVLDLGTGVRAVGPALRAAGARRALVLLSHFHLDHLAGLPAFAPLYEPGFRVVFAAPRMGGGTAGEALPRLMAPPFWPLSLREVPARVAFRTLPRAAARPLAWGGLRIRWAPVHHAGGCTAYRVDEPATGAGFVFATDLEWPAASEAERRAFLGLLARPAPARVLFFDGHFDPAAYPQHRGWGHSRWTDAVELARAAGIRRARILHHAPDRTDASLDRLDRTVRRAWRGARLLRAGDRLRLP